MSAPSVDSERGGGRRAAQFVAIGLHVLVGMFLYLPGGLMVPVPGLAVLAVIWIALLVVAIRWRPANPWATLLVPLAAIALWVAVVQGGSWIFGWTA